MSELCILVLCGLPGAGKTYLTQRLKSSQEFCTFKFIAVEYDRLLPQDLEKVLIESGETAETSWKTYRAEIVRCVDVLIGNILECWKCGESLHMKAFEKSPDSVNLDLWHKFVAMLKMESDTASVEDGDIVCIVIDDNMYYRSMRYPYFQLARKYTIGFCELYLELDLATAISQNQQREIKVTDDIIVAMATKMEAPDSKIHKWEENSLMISKEFDIEAVCQLLIHAVQNPVQPLDEPDFELQNQSRVICSENFLYQSDIILRKLVSQEMVVAKEKNFSKSNMKTYAASLQSARKQFLADLKSGAVEVPSELVSMATDASKHPGSAVFEFIQSKFNEYFKEKVPD